MNHNDNDGYRLLLIFIFVVIAFLTFLGLRFVMSLADLDYSDEEPEVTWQDIVNQEEIDQPEEASTEEVSTEEASTEENQATTESKTEIKPEDDTTKKEESPEEDPHRFEHARGFLSSETEKKLYDELYQGLKDGQTSVEITKYGDDVIKSAFEAMDYDHPELFWLTGGYSWIGDGTKITVTPNMSVKTKQLSTKRQEFEEAKKKALDGVDPKWDNYQTIVYFHDYLVNHCIYNLEACEKNEKANSNHDTAPNEVFIAADAYGCLVNQSAICQGYQEAMQVLCNSVGIKCIEVAGTGKGGSHAWNIVYVDGVPYQIDVTWDDPTKKTQEETNKNQELKHDYCLITDAEMFKDHIATTKNLPICDKTENNYFVKEKMTADSYDFETINQMMNEQYKKNKETFVVKFIHPDEVEKAETKLMDSGKWASLDVIEKNKLEIQYSTNEDLGIMEIYYKKK